MGQAYPHQSAWTHSRFVIFLQVREVNEIEHDAGMIETPGNLRDQPAAQLRFNLAGEHCLRKRARLVNAVRHIEKVQHAV